MKLIKSILTKKRVQSVLTMIAIIFSIHSCTTYYFRSNYRNVNSLIHETSNLSAKLFLKAHHHNGSIYILQDSWEVDTIQNLISGSGIHYNYNRNKISEGLLFIPIDSIVVFETNKKLIGTESGRIAALSILAGINVGLGIYCLTNPKACFGSCPTFYLNENHQFHYADAEGFSNAISPSLEYYDIDALYHSQITEKLFSITMKNEALETHCVKEVKLLVYPKRTGENVYQTSTNEFYLCENLYPINYAFSSEGDIANLLKYEDRKEWFSLSDESNMIRKEEIHLIFDNVNNINTLGLIINFRQTLMTTYLFYSAMGYMGDEVSDIFARFEGDTLLKRKLLNNSHLGGIDIYLWNDDNIWEYQQTLNETGPIAINKQFIPLNSPLNNSQIKVKLILNKGLWRLDYVALTNIKKLVKPEEVYPESILNKGVPDGSALESLKDSEKYLISMPGSEYKFIFVLPEENTDYEVFLYSKGYYLEWMRDHWLKDKDLIKLNQMVNNPVKYYKEEAKSYKQYEATMEQEFWNSRIDTKTYSYEEN
jgi:hypothetical protein